MCLSACFCIGFAGYFLNTSTTTNNKLKKTFRLVAVENIAYGEYIVGPAGTNWRTYTTECTYIKNGGTGIIHLGPIGDVGYESPNTVQYTVTKNVCGYGGGSCLPSSGC